MKASLPASLAALSAANALLAAAAPLELRIDPDGFVGFPGGGIRVCAFFPGWATAMVKPDFVAAEEDAAKIVGAEAGKPFAVVRRRDGGAFSSCISPTSRATACAMPTNPGRSWSSGAAAQSSRPAPPTWS